MLEKLDTLIAFAVVMLGVSLLITILTQIVSTALGLRGSNLLWGLETLFQELAPALEAAGVKPGDLAKEILQDPLISDSGFSRMEKMKIVGPLVGYLARRRLTGWAIDRWRFATAIRGDELVRMVQRKAVDPATPAAVVTALNSMLDAPEPGAARRLKMLGAALANISPPTEAAAQRYAVQVDKIFHEAVDTAQQSVGKLETWFSGTMDRVAQRFVMQVRVWTVVFAFIIAFAAHLDSLHLLQQLSVSPDMRAALVNVRDGMLGQAKDILPPAGAAPTATELPVSTTTLQEALDQLKTTDPAVAKFGPIPDGTITVAAAAAWVAKQPGAPPSVDGEYRMAVVQVLRGRVLDINHTLAQAGFELLPVPYPGLFIFDGQRNLLGVFLGAALLSLGAPFWYNALKNLSNLRTVVASKEDSETGS